MDSIGLLVKRRLDQVVFENEGMKAGFAAVPYVVLRDKLLSSGAFKSYCILLMYAWQEGSTFAGQARMAFDMGVSERQLRRYLGELVSRGYIRIKHQGLNKPNIYYILDVRTKLKRKKSEADRT